MYNIIKAAINTGDYKLDSMLARIRTFAAKGLLNADEMTDLEGLAREHATVKADTDLFEKVFELSNDKVIDEYKKRSVVIGREIRIVREEGDIRAAALDICEDGALLVRTEEGYTRKLCGGEISIKIKR